MKSLLILIFSVVVLIMTPLFTFAEEKSPYEIPEKLTEEEKREGPYLSSASVYPEWGVPCTKFTYKVIYQDEKGRPPTYVRIHLNGEWHDMENVGGDPKGGMTYVYYYIPTSGKGNFYYFEASNGVGKARAGIIDSPNQGPMIYSEKFDNNQVILLQKNSNQPIWTFDTGNDMVIDVAVSKNGEYVAAATFTSIYLFSKESNEPIWRFCEYYEELLISKAGFRGVAISADGDYIAGNWDDTLYLFQRESNVPLWSADIECSAIGVDISDDGKYIAAGVANAGKAGDKLFFFSSESNEPLWEYKADHPGYEQTGNFYSPDVTPDGKYVAVSTGCPDRRAYLFSKDGDVVFRSEMLTHDSPVHKSAISDDGSLIAYSADHNNGQEIVFLFDDQGNKLWSFSSQEDATARAISISANGDYVAAGTTGGHVYLFSKESNVPLWKFTATGYFTQIGDVKLSSTGDYLVAGGTTKKVYLFSRDSSEPLWEYDANTWINAVDFNDEYIVAGTGLVEYLYEGNSVSPQEIECEEIIEPPGIEEFITGFSEAPEEEMSGLEEERAGVEPLATVSRNAVCGDGICERDKGETHENCPQDCVPEGEVKPKEERTSGQPMVIDQEPVPATPTFSILEWRLVGGIIAGSVVFGILVYFLARRKRGTS